MKTPDRKKTNTVCTTPEHTLNCCGISSPLFTSSHDSELRDQSSVSKLRPGLHIPPHTGDTSKFIWDQDSAPLSPPESTSRSIDFKQLGSSSERWPFQFLNEDLHLHFNKRSPVTSTPLYHSPNSGFSLVPTLISTDSCSTSVIQNNAPVGLGGYEYHIDPSRETSWFRRVWSWMYNNPRSSAHDLSQRKRLLIALFLLFAIFLSSAFLGLYRHDDGRTASSVNSDNYVSDVLSRKLHIKARILEAKVTSEELFDDLNSPQSTSLEWMTNDDPLRLEPSDSGLIERYASVVFYFSCSENEYNASNWLSDKPICEWSGFTCIEVDDSSESAIIGFEFVTGRIDGPLVSEILIAFPVSLRETLFTEPSSIDAVTYLISVKKGFGNSSSCWCRIGTSVAY